MFRNETMGIVEWLNHYRFHGVDHVYLVNDFSEDDYITVLKPFIDDGFVTLFENDISERYTGRQIDISNKFFIPIVNESQWVAQIDCDEYLYSPKSIDLKKILYKYESYAGVIANWVWFGSNGHINQPESIVHGFTKRCPYDHALEIMNPRGFKETSVLGAPKIIVNSNFNVSSFDVHGARLNGKTINVSHIAMPNDPELLINHYQVQSREYWAKVKMNRGDCNHIFLGNPRNFQCYESKDFGDIEDYTLSNQNKNINIKRDVIGYNRLGSNGFLGNQMFQYASLRGIAENMNYDYVIPTPNNYYGANYGLFECFKMKSVTLDNFRDNDTDFKNHNSKVTCFDDDIFNNCPPNVNLNDYFQTEKYFNNIEKVIRDDFTFKDHIYESCKPFVDSLHKPIFLHVRRGDYLNAPDHHPVCSIEYYEKALSYFDDDCEVIICSNDIEWCKTQELFSTDRFLISEGNDKYGHSVMVVGGYDKLLIPYCDLCLMSLCSGGIIANSSMSWWGAWLQNDRGKIVAPKNWYGPSANNDTKDLYPDNWEII
jgi:hypothetical protein